MFKVIRYFILFIVATFAVEIGLAQEVKIREVHKVKRKETVFGIAKQYGITIDELKNVNPQMRIPGYELKKGDKLNIPFHVENKVEVKPVEEVEEKPVKPTRSDVRTREVRVGVILPLHDKDADGKRMIEYYRGVLMACDSLKLEGISVDVRAWNIAKNANVSSLLEDKGVAECDLIIGPFYSNQLKQVSDFAIDNNIKVLLPFPIKITDVSARQNLFLANMSDDSFNESTILNFLDKFADCKTVFIDCNDSLSRKGRFTMELRKRLTASGRSFSITNLNSRENDFSKAFSRTQPNVVVLNTATSPQLNVAFSKLNNLVVNEKDVVVSMFGYPEWMNYTTYNLDNYYQFDTYIPTTHYLNPLSARTKRIQQKYRWNFHADMLSVTPRLAIAGFDHAYFFIKGMKLYGSDFDGVKGKVAYTPIQNTIGFAEKDGCFTNKSIFFVHFTRDNKIETLYY